VADGINAVDHAAGLSSSVDNLAGMRVDRQLTEHAEARASSARQALQGIPSRPERYA
jgi:hypothetical protein